MESLQRATSFVVRTEAPASVKLTQVFGYLSWLLFGALWPLWDLFLGVTVSIVFTRPIRAGHGFWFDSVSILLALAAWTLIGLAGLRFVYKTKWFTALIVGRPRFSPLPSPGSASFRLMLNSVKTLELKFTPPQERTIRGLGRMHGYQMEEIYRHRYASQGFNLEGWPLAWQEIKSTSLGSYTLEQAVACGRAEIFLNRVIATGKIIHPMRLCLLGGAVWFLDNMARGGSPLHLAQFVCVGGFVTALITFINVTISFRSISILEEGPFAEEVNRELVGREGLQIREMLTRSKVRLRDEDPESADAIDASLGTTFYPEIVIHPGYIEGVRQFYARSFAVVGLYNASILVLLLLMQWLASIFLSPWLDTNVFRWTVRMALGILSVEAGFTLAFLLAFVVLSKLRKAVGIVTTAVIVAVIPPVLTYLIKGSADTATIITSAIAAAITAIPDIIAELVKAKPGAGQPQTEKTTP